MQPQQQQYYPYQIQNQSQAQLKRTQDAHELRASLTQFHDILNSPNFARYPQVINRYLNHTLAQQNEHISDIQKGMPKSIANLNPSAVEQSDRRCQEALNRALEKNIVLHNEFLKLQSYLEEAAMKCAKLQINSQGEAEISKRMSAIRIMFITIKSKLTALNMGNEVQPTGPGSQEYSGASNTAQQDLQNISAGSLYELKNAAEELANNMKKEYEVLEDMKRHLEKQDNP